MLAAGAAGLAQNRVRFEQSTEVFVEKDRTGQPHKGKVLAAIQPHSDDLPLFAAGTIIKLIREGYTGILIRTTNDEMAGAGATIGEVILNNEKDNAAIAEKMGLKKILQPRLSESHDGPVAAQRTAIAAGVHLSR